MHTHMCAIQEARKKKEKKAKQLHAWDMHYVWQFELARVYMHAYVQYEMSTEKLPAFRLAGLFVTLDA